VTIIQKNAVDFNEAVPAPVGDGGCVAFFHACRRRFVCLCFLRKFPIQWN